MILTEVIHRLREDGIDLPEHTIRRRIDRYVEGATRGKMNNFRDITPKEYRKLLVGLAIESKGVRQEIVEDYMAGLIPKVSLTVTLINSSKVDNMLKGWVNE